MANLTHLIVLLAALSGTIAVRNYTKVYHFLVDVYPEIESLPGIADLGEPESLTPYIEAGNVGDALELASVDYTVLGLTDPLTSYAGYLTVNESCNSNMYFWFFPATNVDPADAPVLLWLQGGPGASSIFGLFVENGPFSVNRHMELELREHSWSNFSNLLYIDNPVGTGYSFTDFEECYARNEDDVGRDLYAFLVQFFTLFSDYQTNEFYISGESYAGKYVPAIGYKIYKENPTADLTINLKGLAIGDGYTDPYHMLDFADVLYNLGFLDDQEYETMEYQQLLAQQHILEKNWIKATYVSNQLMTYYTEVTGMNDVYNYMDQDEPAGQSLYGYFIQQPDIRSAIHVNNQTFGLGARVAEYMYEDIQQTVKPWVEEMLANSDLRIMFYNGLLDIICGHTLTQKVLENLFWDGKEAFLEAERIIWSVNDDIAGYVRQEGTLTFAVVRNAGHMVPTDQPAFAYDLLYRFVMNSAYD